MSFVESSKHQVIAPKETDLNILPGKFNNLDIEAAVMAVSELGIDRDSGVETLKSFKLPEGRLEEVENNLGIKIFIDFNYRTGSITRIFKFCRTCNF